MATLGKLAEQIAWCHIHLPKNSWRCYATHFWFDSEETATYFALIWSNKDG
jgi:hypothetical protein